MEISTDEVPYEEGGKKALRDEIDRRSVTLHIFVRGQGPRHVVEHQLVGWDADRINIREILQRHRLKALFAFSASGTRGLRLIPNPRNGLSLTSYRPHPGAVIRLDAEPQDSIAWSIFQWSGAVLLLTAVVTGVMASQGHSFFVSEEASIAFSELNRTPSWHMVALGVLAFVLLFWKRLTMWYK